MDKKKKSRKRHFVLVLPDKTNRTGYRRADPPHEWTGKQPSVAARKAGTAGFGHVFLRDTVTHRVHEFDCSRKKVPRPATAPAWLPAEPWEGRAKKRFKKDRKKAKK